MRVFQRGDRVIWNGRAGSVAYVRMAPPDCATPQAYSIVLDDRRGDLGYTGTTVLASELEAAESAGE